MQLNFPSLRLSITLTIIAMGFISLALAIYTGETYQTITLNNQKNAISKLIQHDTNAALENLDENLTKLGLNLQHEKYFKDIFDNRKKDAILQEINRHFHQYFVTAGIIDLEKIYVYDINFNLISASTEKPENNFDEIICSELIFRAQPRTGATRLVTLNSLCKIKNRNFYSSLVPIGGLIPKGYLQIVANPVHSLKKIDKRLGSPIKISSPQIPDIYKTKNWPDENNLKQALLAGYDLYSNSNQYIFTISTAHNISELNLNLRETRNYLILTALLIIFASMIISFIVLRRSTTTPVKNLLTQLKKIRENKDNLGQQIQIIGARELKEVAIEFNRMTNELKQLYQKISENNQLLKNEVNERKLAEEALQVAHHVLEEKIEERTIDLKKTSEQAQKANMAKSEFLSRMSHELRTPLNAILGYSELLLSDTVDKLSDNHRYEVEVTLRAGMHLLSLINEVLDLSSIEAGKISISKDEVSLDHVIKETSSLISPIADKNNITVEYNYNQLDHIYITTEHQRLKQILLNLLSNAVKYNKKNGRVIFTVEYISDKKLKISITDTGIGIASEEQKSIFTPFNRLEKYKARVDGTGIGLTITKSLVELMGGEIGIDSILEAGSTFWITLPYHKKEATKQNAPLVQKSVTSEIKHHFGNKKILIVEDDEANQELMAAMMKVFSVEADIAGNGLEALEKIQHNDDYSFIFMDLNMPKMDGLEATKAIRNLDSEKSQAIIIALTANAMQGDKERCLDAGMNDYVQKPISLKVLKETLDKWL